MIFFGHVGITTAAFKLYENIVPVEKVNENESYIDYRLVAIGSILPDIIDKPIGAYFFRSTFHNSRIFAHSLVFSMFLIILGSYYFKRSKNNGFITLGVCSLIHQILDSMWLYPGILFWPAYGLKFPTRPEGNWLAMNIANLLRNPAVYMPEIIGAIIVGYYFIMLVKNKRVKEFLKSGRL
ncbi:hydrolase [Clostridium carboxidivorans P7]|uniref:Membrane-bound metal-dependent hydrolase n=1 Tax=Clostridium carboxidivorans P7 TaxID=536227 RepID=C6Q300_9CLOT|nr:metal-dependent hydrolase [Clostridium carboxidivorans]AKN29780.1 hydrolase [Clostridium carboxidivorans P7]EET84131.1 membrane-bound metal-dependent hydrolase [Clostridium carboxidivorans P7]